MIEIIGVDRDDQRRGKSMFSRLTEHAAEHMRRSGMDIVVVETGGDPGHAPARAAYEAAGFTLLPVARYFRMLGGHSRTLAHATTFAPRVPACTLHTRSEDDYAELLRRGCPSRARRRQSAASPREKAMKLSRGVARFNKRVTNRIQGLYAGSFHRGRSSSTAVTIGPPVPNATLCVQARPDSRHRTPVWRGVGVASQPTRRGWARDPCGAYLRRRSPRGRRYAGGRLAARTPVASGARVLPARRETGDARPGGTAARLWAPRPPQRACVTRSSTRPGNGKSWARHTCRCSYGHA